jgi:16S rRNA (adenine1518-N6/adenine1519-N6)-dimethyltransferase
MRERERVGVGPHARGNAAKASGAGVAPLAVRKRFGQHFLEPAWVEKVIRAIDPRPDETFIEIGPGRGALTRPLAAAAKAIVAYEIDRDLAAQLRDTAPPNVTIVEGDFLEANPEPGTSNLEPRTPNPEARTPSSVRVAGNLPYNVASPILFRLVDLSRRGLPIADATVMLQREVADRLAADPGSRDYGVLSVLIQHRATVERLLILPPGAFRPPPKVQSAVVRLRFHLPNPAVRDESMLERVVQAVFTRRRKTLANALLVLGSTRIGADAILAAAGLDGGRRPETLTVGEFARLADAI